MTKRIFKNFKPFHKILLQGYVMTQCSKGFNFLTNPFLPHQLNLLNGNINILNVSVFMSSHQQELWEKHPPVLQNHSFMSFVTSYFTKEEATSHTCCLIKN